jgi:hypothetical protein
VNLIANRPLRLTAAVALAAVILGAAAHASFMLNGAAPNGAAPNGGGPNGSGPNGAGPNTPGPNGPGSNGYASMTPVSLGVAGLNYNALLTNRNALPILVGQQLGPGLFADPYMRLQLTDSDARGVFRYLYGCACPPEQSFTTSDDPAKPAWATTAYVGEVGLAPGWCGKGGQARVTKSQRELVSACVAARVNVQGNVAPVSLRHPNINSDGHEVAAFRFREGAFYGDLFTGPQEWVNDVEVQTDGTVVGKDQVPPQGLEHATFPSLYVCLDPGWTDPSAYANARVCSTLPDCVGVYVGSCENRCTPPARDRNSRTRSSYSTCSDPSGSVWTSPLTSFVLDRCAFSPDPDTCRQWSAATIK